MNSEKQIEVLNTLIVINNDRIEGYETAGKETEEKDLKSLFAQFQQTSEKVKSDLEKEVTRLGGKVAEGTRTTGKFFRVWMDVKAALTGKNRKVVLESCEQGEDVAQETYTDALDRNAENLSTEQIAMLTAQKMMLMKDHNTVKHLRDAVVAS